MVGAAKKKQIFKVYLINLAHFVSYMRTYATILDTRVLKHRSTCRNILKVARFVCLYLIISFLKFTKWFLDARLQKISLRVGFAMVTLFVREFNLQKRILFLVSIFSSNCNFDKSSNHWSDSSYLKKVSYM